MPLKINFWFLNYFEKILKFPKMIQTYQKYIFLDSLLFYCYFLNLKKIINKMRLKKIGLWKLYQLI
jgi:hypothetical protein